MIGPACSMKPGHNNPSWKLNAVPLTAPVAKSTAAPWDQARVSLR